MGSEKSRDKSYVNIFGADAIKTYASKGPRSKPALGTPLGQVKLAREPTKKGARRIGRATKKVPFDDIFREDRSTNSEEEEDEPDNNKENKRIDFKKILERVSLSSSDSEDDFKPLPRKKMLRGKPQKPFKMKCAQYLEEVNTLSSTPSQAPKEFELTMTPVGIPMSNLTNISVESTDTSNDSVKPNNSHGEIEKLVQDTSRPLFDLNDDTPPTFPFETSNNDSAEPKSENSDVPNQTKQKNVVPDLSQAKLPIPLEKNKVIPEVTDVSNTNRPKPLSREIPQAESEKLTITPPSVDNSIAALKRLENRARRTRLAAVTKPSKPPTARGYRFTEASSDVSLTSRPSRRVSIQDTSRITGRSKQRRSKNRSLVLQETPKAFKKDISQLHAEDFTPIRPSIKKKIDNKDELEKNLGKELRKRIPTFEIMDTPPKAVTKRSTRVSSVQDRNVARPKAPGRRTFVKSRRSMSESDVVPDVSSNKPSRELSKLATHTKSACPPVSKAKIQDKTSKRRSTRISSQRVNETTNSPSLKKPRLSRQPTKSRSKNSSNIDLFMPDCFSPVLSKKTKTKLDTNRKLSPKSVLMRLNSDDNHVEKSQSDAPPASKPPPKAGSSLLSRPLLLRSKPSTEGFKMPKSRSKSVRSKAPPKVNQSRINATASTTMNSTILDRKGRLSSAIFLKRIQRSSFLHLGSDSDDSFDEIQLTQERKNALVKLKQSKIITLAQMLKAENIDKIKTITKIGEGAFGEVFKYFKNGSNHILKVIPVDGDIRINDSPQKKIIEVLNEYLIASQVSSLNGFAGSSKAYICSGVYPKALTDAWNLFDTQNGSQNEKPWEKLPKKQIYITLKMNDCGQDLEKMAPFNASSAIQLLKTLSKNLERAETELKFEHRDLHPGNILIREENDVLVPSIIDYTLSRCMVDGGVLFADLEYDPEIFESQGDPQYDVYRHMKSATQSNWEEFHPKTNVLWIAFLAGWFSRNLKGKTKTAKTLANASRSLKIKSKMEDVVERLEQLFPN